MPPPSDAPTSAPPTKMAAVVRDVSVASVGDERTWYLDVDMKVCVCPSISEEAVPTYVAGGGAGVEVVQVVTRGQVVWALTPSGQLLFRIGINSSKGSLGQDWGVMACPDAPHTPVTPLVGLALGPDGRGWVVDSQGRLYFREGVCNEFPQGEDLKWWQVLSSRYMVGEEVRVGGVLLATSHQGIWLAELGAQTCCIHTPAVIGHCWELFSEDVWAAVCAEGLYTTQGALCCLSPLGQLFLINPNTASCVPLEIPNSNKGGNGSSGGDSVVCVSQRPEVLWVLTSDGRVFIRAGLSASSLLGTHWDELDLSQIGDIQLCHISCGTEVVWGVDTRGGVYMRQGPLTPCLTQSLPPAWIQVEPSVGSEVEITKVYVGARLHLVWALDSCLRVYVRQAIYPELPVGLSWVCVPGLLATHLSISEDQVVALTPSGEVFCRTGVSGNNFIGDAWERIPGRLAGLSVTTDNTLWGLNSNGCLCRHLIREVDCDDATTTTTTTTQPTPAPRLHTLSFSSDHEDWEVL